MMSVVRIMYKHECTLTPRSPARHQSLNVFSVIAGLNAATFKSFRMISRKGVFIAQRVIVVAYSTLR